MKSTVDENFCRRLRELREAAGLTQQQLGEKAEMHRLSVAHIEQGLRAPTWATVRALAQALGVSCEAFCQEPTAMSGKRGPGRPSRHPASARQDTAETTKGSPRRKRGRPRKVKGT